MGRVHDALGKIYDQLAAKNKAVQSNRADDLRTLIVLLGDSENGESVEIDTDHYEQVIEAAGVSISDVRASVEVYKTRSRDARLAVKSKELTVAADAAGQAFRAADLVEGTRRRAAMEELTRLEDAEREAISESTRAVAAAGDLIATARRTDAELQLIAEQAEINREIKTESAAVDPNRTLYSEGSRGAAIEEVGPTYWPNIDTHPAALARQTRQHLNRENTGYSKERVAELKNQNAMAEAEVTRREKILADLIKKLAASNSKLEKLNDRKLLAEEFVLQKARPTEVERLQQNARQLGVAAR